MTSNKTIGELPWDPVWQYLLGDGEGNDSILSSDDEGGGDVRDRYRGGRGGGGRDDGSFSFDGSFDETYMEDETYFSDDRTTHNNHNKNHVEDLDTRYQRVLEAVKLYESLHQQRIQKMQQEQKLNNSTTTSVWRRGGMGQQQQQNGDRMMMNPSSLSPTKSTNSNPNTSAYSAYLPPPNLRSKQQQQQQGNSSSSNYPLSRDDNSSLSSTSRKTKKNPLKHWALLRRANKNKFDKIIEGKDDDNSNGEYDNDHPNDDDDVEEEYDDEEDYEEEDEEEYEDRCDDNVVPALRQRGGSGTTSNSILATTNPWDWEIDPAVFPVLSSGTNTTTSKMSTTSPPSISSGTNNSNSKRSSTNNSGRFGKQQQPPSLQVGTGSNSVEYFQSQSQKQHQQTTTKKSLRKRIMRNILCKMNGSNTSTGNNNNPNGIVEVREK